MFQYVSVVVVNVATCMTEYYADYMSDCTSKYIHPYTIIINNITNKCIIFVNV
jgi:hypothetical protein